MPLRIHDERLTRRVGAATLVVAVLFAAFVVRVWDRLGRSGTEVRVHFGEASGVREGAPVMVAGQRVGRVAKIRMDDGGGIVLTATIEPSWAKRIPVNSEFFIGARGLLAPRYLEIGAPPHHALPDRPLAAGDDVTGVDPPNLDRLLQRIWTDLTEVKLFADALRPAAATLRLSIARLSTTLDTLVPEADWGAFERAIADLEALPGFDLEHAGEVADRAGAALDVLGGQLATVRIAIARTGDRVVDPARDRVLRVIATVESAVALAGELIDQVRGLVADATGGTGSLAMLLADLEMVDDIKAMTMIFKRQPWLFLPSDERKPVP